MGQANSRNTPLQSSSSHPPQAAQDEPATSSQRTRTDSLGTINSSASKKSHSRHSLRRTVRALLPASHHRSKQQHKESTDDDPSHFLRRRWRSSKRLSQPHSPLSSPAQSPNTDDAPPPSVNNASSALGSEVDRTGSGTPLHAHSSLPSSPDLLSSSTTLDSPPASSLSEQLSQSEVPISCVKSDALDLTAEPSTVSATVLARHGDTFDEKDQIERELDDFLSPRPDDKTFVEGSSRDGQNPTPLPSTTSPATSPAINQEPEPQPTRHFQPPGPLVVVQGVVNTSDSTSLSPATSGSRPTRSTSDIRPSSGTSMSEHHPSSAPRTSARSESARRRLSAFIPRPSSMISRRPSSLEQESIPSYGSLDSNDTSNSSEHSTSDLRLSEESSVSADADQRPSSDNESRPRPLSPGSIDVLGTLLSVAAAATAASLFSPSLGFQNNIESGASPSSAIPRPMSPTPTAGLGEGGGLGSLAGFGLDHPTRSSPSPTPPPQHRDGRERIRNVWDSFRDRLGLNRSASPLNTSEDVPTSSDDQGAQMRPGEVMLAEMARALNIGLGLNGDGSNTAPRPSSDSLTASEPEAPRQTNNAPADRRLPPEDSFERFLVNLQADLRTALSEDGAQASASSNNQDGRNSPVDEDAQSRLPAFNELPVGLADPDDDNDDDEPPPLQEVSDSESEDDEEAVHADTLSTRTPTPMPASSTVPPNRVDQSSPRGRPRAGSGSADRGPPGINLWRLYRFQPIPASQVSTHAAATTTPQAPVSSSAVLGTEAHHSPPPTSPVPPAVSETPSPSSVPASDTPADTVTDSTESTTAGDPGLHMVVPVIVVGLQSVEMGQVHGHGHAQAPESDQAPPSDSRDADRRHSTASSFDDGYYVAGSMEGSTSTGTGTGTSSGSATPRGRGNWQSRAASALRNLRPGRRNGSRGRRTAESAGSRTFLIYVIGGYYPPNHHMVTGSDNLDSYEALWELAELLGQVKPPVATQDDIDKSGLQIIHSSELEHYERMGRVASNCVERCLICLDDYGEEDELRLMTCKHAFHKDCVDKWLQVGRNNCPACRTKGVSTAGDAPV